MSRDRERVELLIVGLWLQWLEWFLNRDLHSFTDRLYLMNKGSGKTTHVLPSSDSGVIVWLQQEALNNSNICQHLCV